MRCTPALSQIGPEIGYPKLATSLFSPVPSLKYQDNITNSATIFSFLVPSKSCFNTNTIIRRSTTWSTSSVV